MRPVFSTVVFIAVTLSLTLSSAFGNISLQLGGNVGLFTLPKETGGNISQYTSVVNRYMWDEVSTNEYGYTQYAYKYKHPFPSKTLPNAGVNFGISYTYQSQVGVFLEGCWASSIRDQTINQSVPDSLAADNYAMIPHDYRTRVIESTDLLYTKFLEFSLGISYAVPLAHKARFIVACGIGSSDFSQFFRIETKSVTMNYFQNNGHIVYHETENQGAFEVFGISYDAFCVKPAAAVEWEVRSPLSIRAGLSYPFSLIEKGAYFHETNTNYSLSYYPSKRFMAGNVILTIGVSLGLGKGDNQ